MTTIFNGIGICLISGVLFFVFFLHILPLFRKSASPEWIAIPESESEAQLLAWCFPGRCIDMAQSHAYIRVSELPQHKLLRLHTIRPYGKNNPRMNAK